MGQLVKVFNKEIAEELKTKGFNYIIENINKQKVYVFEASKEFLYELTSKCNYTKNEYIYSNKLSF